MMALSPNTYADSFWLTELDEMEDPMLLHGSVGDYLVDYPPEEIATLMNDQELHYTFSPGSECNSSDATGEICDNSLNHKNPNDYAFNTSNYSNHIAESNRNSQIQQHSSLSPEQPDTPAPVSSVKMPKRPRRLPDQCQSHIIAERQRRQTLSERFIALSALIPGLKKMDKTTVLGEAITHMKELKERLKILEEENAQRAIESIVVEQRSSALVENDSNSSSSSETLQDSLHKDAQIPEIEARFSDRSVLIKIHCHMRSGLLSTIINKIESIKLSITNTTSMPFNNRTLDITIMAQMGMDFAKTPDEVVSILRSIF